MEINLDEHFRQSRHSKARTVAEALLSGRPYSRQELSDLAGGVSVTTVNRVVEVLSEAGANILRETIDRQAVYRLVDVSEPARRVRPPALDADGQIVRDDLVGGTHVVDFTSDDQRFRGRFPGLSGLPPVATSVMVAGIERRNDDMTVVLETSTGKRVRLEYVENITD